MISYRPAFDQAIAEQLRRRFADAIAVLAAEGFNSFSLHQEVVYPFSLVLNFPVFLAMHANREILRIEPPLRVSSFHLMYSSPAHATYAYLYGMGVKFYTSFSDGTWLVSNTHQKIRDPRVIVLRPDPGLAAFPQTAAAQVWKRHQAKIAELEAGGRRLNPHLSFDAWAGVEKQFDRSNLLQLVGTGVIWLLVVIWAAAWLVGQVLDLLGAG